MSCGRRGLLNDASTCLGLVVLDSTSPGLNMTSHGRDKPGYTFTNYVAFPSFLFCT